MRLVVADKKGKIYDLTSCDAVGMKGGSFFRLPVRELIELPYGSELFMLPERAAVGYVCQTRKFVSLDNLFAVAAFISPGYTVSYNSAYRELNRPRVLPLFAYAAVAFCQGKFYVAALRVDKERRHDLRLMNINLVKRNAQEYKRLFPHNRLVKHLQDCALVYGCPTAKNFFLARYEAPLPSAPYCNAKCLGCISYQPSRKCMVTQPRIKFFPTAEEVAEVALHHLHNACDSVVSFGQGCEGEPLLAKGVIEAAIKLIRRKTNKGIININTNASRPRIIAKLFDAGLNSIRVSLNSAQEKYYLRYYQPKGYNFQDVLGAIKTAKQKGGFVSLNYLTIPGFTDQTDEFNALKRLIHDYRIDMIQWRNLNFDPLRYFQELKISVGAHEMLGIRPLVNSLKKSFPQLMMGYFNPSRRRIKRHFVKIKWEKSSNNPLTF